ncbi:inactive receptor-like serine/threonine-protein kinase At2g40270 [Tasmannia lanceolata]|uniref:inactive receptor-like serine/threonine-protein kinase At2g40270 n=1 Tax=Tasmannia lanceolata TaxID=3420 RepID=UPI0040627C3E
MKTRLRLNLVLLIWVSLLLPNLDFCCSLNSEGLALLNFQMNVQTDPFGALLNWGDEDDDDSCSWFGVGCVDGKVVSLNLKNLCLVGILTPELGKLSHIRSLILHNNSFYGAIRKEIGELKSLEVLDLGHNNFSGPLPSELGNIQSLETLLLNNNSFSGAMSPKLHELSIRSELHAEKNVLSSTAQEASRNRRSITRNIKQVEFAANRRLLEVGIAHSPSTRRHEKNKSKSASSPHNLSPSPSPSPSGSSARPIFLPPEAAPAPAPMNDLPSHAPVNPPIIASAPHSIPVSVPSPNPDHPTTVALPPSLSVPIASPSVNGSQLRETGHQSEHSFPWVTFVAVTVGVSFLLSMSGIVFLFCRNNKVVTVGPWATGLSGQLQKAFVTGVPSLKRSELETACEDFSNIIGTLSDSTVYKGTLSSGVEIAVISSGVMSAKDWPKHSEAQFRKKIATLSGVNHKNFVNLLGYCEEENPFTRMMVFEYAPNGTLFEHLHIEEAEHLDWGVRLRIAMGMAYCLDHMHQLNPRIIHRNLQSSMVYLTEDYAAKLADFSFWDDLDASLLDPAGNVYNFGLILLEMMSGKLPYSEANGLLVEWASDYLKGDQPLRQMMDPTLKSFQDEQAIVLCQIIQSCVHPDPKRRPTMRDVTAQLREITEIPPDGATPRVSPLWWAELEILSTTDAS